MIRRNAGPVVIATALVALFVLALLLALAQGKLSPLALDLTEHLLGIVLAVFVLERILAWREERRWLAAQDSLRRWHHRRIGRRFGDQAEGVARRSATKWRPGLRGIEQGSNG